MGSHLQFRSDGTFKIVQFTDLHWAEGGTADQQTHRLMAQVLEAEQPDLVVLTGDLLSGGECEDPAVSLQQALRAAVESGIPWCAVYGNHDDEGSLSRADLMALQQTLPGCLSEAGPEAVSGVGNYVLTIHSAQEESLAAALYFLDSRSYAPEAIGGYGWITRDQIAWYLDTSRELARQFPVSPPLPALAFFHIPLPEYDTVWNAHPCRGVKYEAVCCPRLNTGLFAAFVEAGDVMGTFVGHDHVNDYEGELYGIRLCYGRATGYNTYGREGFPRGARVIQMQEGLRGFTTWLRLDDGSVVTEQPEHAPFGKDSNP